MNKKRGYRVLSKTTILDFSSETCLSASNLSSSNSESQSTITSQPGNVNTLTLSKRPKSDILDTLSKTSLCTILLLQLHTDRPPISEIPITPRSQPNPLSVQTPLFHIPNSETVIRFFNYKQQLLKQHSYNPT